MKKNSPKSYLKQRDHKKRSPYTYKIKCAQQGEALVLNRKIVFIMIKKKKFDRKKIQLKIGLKTNSFAKGNV